LAGNDLRDIINDKVETLLENPCGSEETRPCLNDIHDVSGLVRIEEQGASPNLSEFGVPES